MITDFPCWVDVDIARFQKYKKIRKIKIYKKKKRKRKEKEKVEGLIWKPSKTFPINTMLQWNSRGGEKFYRHEGRRKTEGKKGKNLNLQKNHSSRHPLKPTHSPPLLWLWESKPERTPHKERAAGHPSSLGEANQRSAAPLPLKQKTRSPLSCHFSLWPFGLPSFPCWGRPPPPLKKRKPSPLATS